jgi:molybdopterin/thiamine biosynthesis adenylyltransferase
MDPSRRRMKTRLHVNSHRGDCIVRCTGEQRGQLDRLLYKRYPDAEWGTFFRFGYRVTPWGVLVTVVDLLNPNRGDFDERSHVMEFTPGYIGRGLRSFNESSFGIGFIHSHPEACAPIPSFSDDDMDSYFAIEFERFSNGRPYVSLIASRDEDGRRCYSGRCFLKGEWFPVTRWITVGKDQIGRESNYSDQNLSEQCHPSRERARQLMGKEASSRITNSTLGIVGCSGLGTPVGHILARAGVGEFILVDPGNFKDSNHERNHASRAHDLSGVELSKVALLERLIREVNPNAKVTCLKADILAPQTVDALVRCDLLLGCTDSVYARSALGDLSTHYLVPVIDMAVQMGAKDNILHEQVGEVARYMPGLPCPWCRKRVNSAAIRAELATDDERMRAADAARLAVERGEDGAQYWIGEHVQELTVGYMTTAVAAMGAGYAQGWLTGISAMPTDRFQFDLGKAGLAFVPDHREPEADCSCQKCIGFADQGRADFSVSYRGEGQAIR